MTDPNFPSTPPPAGDKTPDSPQVPTPVRPAAPANPPAAPPPQWTGPPGTPPPVYQQPPPPPQYGQAPPQGYQPYPGQYPPPYGYGMPPGAPPPGYPQPPKRRNRLLPVIIGVSILAVVVVIGVIGLLSIPFGGSTTSSTTPSLNMFGGKIGILYVEGVLGEGTGYEANTRVLVDQVNAWRKNDAIKALVIRINSPGGAVSATQDLYSALNMFRAPDDKGNKRPIFVSMGDVAASGGYYTSLAADEVYANDGTITGSIGVIMSFYDYQGLQDKVGVRSRNVKSGEFKDIGSGSRAMTTDEKELLSGMITNVYDQFLDAAVAGRGKRMREKMNPTAPANVSDDMVREQIRQYADGRVFSGSQAAQYGMIDGIKTLDEVIRIAAQRVGLDVEKPSIVRAPIKPQGLFGTMNSIATKMDKNPLGMQQGVKMEYRFGAD